MKVKVNIYHSIYTDKWYCTFRTTTDQPVLLKSGYFLLDSDHCGIDDELMPSAFNTEREIRSVLAKHHRILRNKNSKNTFIISPIMTVVDID